MQELFLNGYRIDLPAKSVSQTLQINDLAKLKDRQANYTNRFKLPLTPNNVKAFEYIGIVGNQSRKPYEKINAKLVEDGIELISDGYAQIKATSDNYEIVIYDGNISLYEELKGKRINDLLYDDLNHYLNIGSYERSFSNTEGYIYGIGDFIGTSINNHIKIERQAPSIFVHTIWNKIFTEAGFTYSGDFFENDNDFLTEVITPSKGYDVIDTTTSVSVFGTARTNTISYNEISQGNALIFENRFRLSAISSTLSNIQVINSTTEGDYIVVNYTGNLRISLDINYSLLNGSAYVILKINNKKISYSYLSLGTNITSNKLLNINVQSGDKVKIDMISSTAFIDPEFQANNELNLTAFCEIEISGVTGGQYVDFAKIVSDATQTSFIQDVMQRYGLIFNARKNTKHYDFITIESLLNDRANAEDWSKKISLLGKENYSIGAYAKENQVKYNYEDTVIEPTHNGILYVDNDNISENKTLFTSIFKISSRSITRNGQPIYNIPIWDIVVEDGASVVKNLETDLRLFKIKRINEAISARFFSINNSVTITGDIPYLSLERVEYDFYLNNYYPAFNRILNAPKKRLDIFNLSPIDIYNIDFFKLKYIEQLGQYYYLNKISNYINGKPTKCELIQVNGITFNQPPNQLGVKDITISHGSSIALDLSHFTDTTPAYEDPEFDAPERIKIISGYNSNNVVIKKNGNVFNSEFIINANNIGLVLEDLGNIIPEHNHNFDFIIQSFNSPYYSTSIGTLRVKVRERVNRTPIADAGSARTLIFESSGNGNGQITVSGGGSSDPNGDSLVYQWSLFNEPSVVSLSITAGSPHIVVLSTNNASAFHNNQSFNLTLRVTDPFGAFDEDTIVVTLRDISSEGGNQNLN